MALKGSAVYLGNLTQNNLLQDILLEFKGQREKPLRRKHKQKKPLKSNKIRRQNKNNSGAVFTRNLRM